jgi:hypothetical protein
LLIVSPDCWAQRARCQAETPLIVLCRFPQPALTSNIATGWKAFAETSFLPIVAPLVGVKCSQMTEHRTMYYVVLSDGGSLTYGSTGFFATDKTEAAQKAKDWAKSFDLVQENALLQVTANGVGVCTLRPGELRELRAQA